ncbi:MAG: GTPase Era [Nitrospinae bacterium]|nr:GTPase Era [Nitrospinota bacterium]
MSDATPTGRFVAGYVTLAGRPNVGKSTLLNHYVGRKIAITSPRPQTTRNRIVGIVTRPDAQVVFLDTPGVMKGERSKLNRSMTDVAARTGAEADVLVFMTDASRPDLEGDLFAWRRIDRGKGRAILAINKVDLVEKESLLPLIAQLSTELGPFEEVVPLSATRGINAERLLKLIVDRLPEGTPFYPADMGTDQPERFFIAEMIREKAFLRLSQELPYSLAVVVEQMEDRPNGVFAVSASIVVERESQKGIVIGKGGAMLKEIGAAARRELERRFETKIFLHLTVRVRPQWTSDPASLRDLGYDPSSEG